MANASDINHIGWYYYDENEGKYKPFYSTAVASSTTIEYGIEYQDFWEKETFSERMKRAKKAKAERERLEREMAEFCEWDQQED